MVLLVPGHVRVVLQLAGKTTQVQNRTVWTNGSGVPGHVRAVLQLAGKTTQVLYRTVCGPMVVLVPGHVRAVLQLAGKTTQVLYRTVWTNGSAVF
jgi:hypothetical protein